MFGLTLTVVVSFDFDGRGGVLGCSWSRLLVAFLHPLFWRFEGRAGDLARWSIRWFAWGVDLVFVDLDYHHLLVWSDLGLVGDFFVVSSTIFVEVLPGAELFPFSIHLGV